MKLISEEIIPETGYLLQTYLDDDGNYHELVTDNDGGEMEYEEYCRAEYWAGETDMER